jgi:hypothetical protein
MEQTMDRVIVYPGAIPLETDLLATNKNMLIGLSKLASALFGSNTLVNGFAVTPTGPASLQVVVAPGEIYSLQNVDGTAYSSIAADTSRSILKQGITLDSATLNCPAPTTTGQSISYLVQAAYQDVDAIPTVLPYYNASNPSQAYSGPANNGVAQNTRRNGVAVVSVKTGVSATTGTQTIPAPDVGYVGLYVVTVAFAQTAITSANIVPAPARPQINSSLHGQNPAFTSSPLVPFATLPGQAAQLSQIAAVVGQSQNVAMSVPTTSATATLAADEVIVQTALGGASFCLASFSRSINLATTGAGGMDVGTVPAAGYVALYAIYNPASGASALLGVNATSAKAPEVYGGANMPAGYTASALVSVWRVASSKFIAGCQQGRSISFVYVIAANSTSAVASLTAISLSSIIPINAVSCGGFMAVAGINTTNAVVVLASSASGIGQVQAAGNSTTGGIQNISGGPVSDMKVITPQTLYWQAKATTGDFNGGTVYISSYDF